MIRKLCGPVLLAGLLSAVSFMPEQGRAADGWFPEPPPCEPGYKIIEAPGYKDVCHSVCKMICTVNKIRKPVYDMKTVEYCQRKCPLFDGQGCDNGCCDGGCDRCQLRTRKVLLKKFIICEEPVKKCVLETVVERVPCTLYRKVPINMAVPVQ